MASPHSKIVWKRVDLSSLPDSPESSSPSSMPQSLDSGSRPGSRNSKKSKHEPVWSKLKTTLCRNLVKTGSCAYGETCWYAHTEEEIRSPDDEETGKALAMKIKTLAKRKKNANRVVKQKRSSESGSDVSSEASGAGAQAPQGLPSYFYSMPPPRQHIPFMHQQAGPNGLPLCAQYEKVLIFDNALSTMLHQEKVVINVRHILAGKEAELKTAESKNNRMKCQLLQEELADIRKQLQREEEIYERTKADFGQFLHGKHNQSLASH